MSQPSAFYYESLYVSVGSVLGILAFGGSASICFTQTQEFKTAVASASLDPMHGAKLLDFWRKQPKKWHSVRMVSLVYLLELGGG